LVCVSSKLQDKDHYPLNNKGYKERQRQHYLRHIRGYMRLADHYLRDTKGYKDLGDHYLLDTKRLRVHYLQNNKGYRHRLDYLLEVRFHHYQRGLRGFMEEV
jgi:hypothetical protein